MSLKKFAMAVMLIAGFQQVSADVCKLKVNVVNVLKDNDFSFRENFNLNKYAVGIQIKDGKLGKIIYYDTSTKQFYVNVKLDSKSERTVRNIIAAPNGDNYWLICAKNANQHSIKLANAIFFNVDGEIILNLHGCDNGQRQEEAKRQFENIIKCGLLRDIPQYQECKEQAECSLMHKGEPKDFKVKSIDTFNISIFENPFIEHKEISNVICGKGVSIRKENVSSYVDYLSSCKDKDSGKYITINEGWRMPGLSAFMKDGEDTANVYCAMKFDRINAHDRFWSLNSYNQNEAECFYNYEHTERQLVVNHMCNNRISELGVSHSLRALLYCSDHVKLNSLDNGALFIWTNGNPCTSASSDNGDICCVKWYNNIVSMLAHDNFVYFSKFNGNGVTDTGYDMNKSAIREIMEKISVIVNIPAEHDNENKKVSYVQNVLQNTTSGATVKAAVREAFNCLQGNKIQYEIL